MIYAFLKWMSMTISVLPMWNLSFIPELCSHLKSFIILHQLQESRDENTISSALTWITSVNRCALKCKAFHAKGRSSACGKASKSGSWRTLKAAVKTSELLNPKETDLSIQPQGKRRSQAQGLKKIKHGSSLSQKIGAMKEEGGKKAYLHYKFLTERKTSAQFNKYSIWFTFCPTWALLKWHCVKNTVHILSAKCIWNHLYPLTHFFV